MNVVIRKGRKIISLFGKRRVEKVMGECAG